MAVLIVLLCACEEFCEESNRTAAVVNFYSAETELPAATRIDAIQGLGNDSVLFLNTSLQSALLPLKPDADTTAYIIRTSMVAANDVTVTETDTLIIVYTRHTGFISSECGCAGFAEITIAYAAGRRIIDSVTVSNPNVRTVSYRSQVINAENIRLYCR
ncbi:MAG: hypothetical protein LBS09_07700 [Bacteroidales bacterium]|nr:hypothetical protein [Bacteroidales bacterium]